MKSKVQLDFSGPTRAEELILNNQAAIMTALSAIFNSPELERYSKPLLMLADNTRQYLNRHREKENRSGS